jgi:hypothetical protein
MNLASTLDSFVNSKVRKRGVHYFRGRTVRLTACGPERAEATVTGSTEYDVSLWRDAQALRASCSCPFSDRGEICKHVWAAILAVDAKSGLRGSEGVLPQKLITSAPDEESSRARKEKAGPAPRKLAQPARPALPMLPRIPIPQVRQVSRPPAWRESLLKLAAAAPPLAVPAGSSTRELLYLLDVPATLQSQQLILDVLTGRRKRDGSWPVQLSRPYLSRDHIQGLPDPDDRKILSLVAGGTYNGLWGSWNMPNASSPVPVPCEIPRATADLLIPLLCATGRFYLRSGPELTLGEPLAWNGDEPWEICLEVLEEKRGDCLLTGSLRRGEQRQTKPVLLLRQGFVVSEGQISPLADRAETGAFRWAPLLHSERFLRVPAAEREELLEHLLAAPDLPRLELPASMRIEEARPSPRPRLRLRPPDGPNAWPRAELSFVYDGREVPAGAQGRGLYQREERRLLVRDLETERRSAGRLLELGFKPDAYAPPGKPPLRVPASRVPKAVPALLAEGWSVEAEGKLYRSASVFKMAVASGVDWFELRGEADFDGETIRLPALLAALRRGEKFVPLSDGSLGLLPEEWVKKFAPMAGLGEAEGDHVRFRPSQAVLLDAWLAEEEVTCDEAFERARERLRGFAGVAPAAAPPEFRGELRGYQRAGLGWLHFLREFGFGGCLADDMGLGKTVQVLALLESRRAARAEEGLPPSLVVVPRSLVFNWIAEAAQFAPRLRVLDHTGIGRSRDSEAFAALAQYDLVLTTYGTLRQDVGELRKVEFDYVILDEAQAIKNADSQTAKAARLLRGRHRLALSGTPVENHLGELWSLLEFLNPGLLGASPFLRTHSGELRDPAPETRGMLARALRPFLLRRTKEQVAPELPAKIEQTLYCELPPKQRRLYDELRDHYRGALGARISEQGLGNAKILVLEALLRLRQAACHPGLLDPDRAAEPCAKLDLLLPQLREVLAEGHKALVFSQFTSFLALLRRQLDAEKIPYLYLDGRTRDRQEKVGAFQSNPECRLFLISLKAGGLGLNLTAADYVYLLDPWWNPAVESQAIDRAHRIGQVRPVFASRIVARDTVEEKILDLQKTKRDLADAVIQADRSLLSGLSREDLEMLLS